MKTLAQALELALARAGLSQGADLLRLGPHWEAVVGPASAWARPHSLSEGRLLVVVPSSAHLMEGRMLLAAWKEGLNARVPSFQIKSIRLAVKS